MRWVWLALLALPVFQISVAIPKLSRIYNDRAYQGALTAALAAAAALALALAMRHLRGPGVRQRSQALLFIAAGASLLTWRILATNPVRMSALREVVHIGEFGVLGNVAATTLLLSGGGGAWTIAATAGYGATVGILDELVQLCHPNRRADARDVLVNACAALLGVVWATRVAGRRGSAAPGERDRGPAVVLGGLAASLLLVLWALAHTGFEIRDPDCGTFRSNFQAAELRAIAARGEEARYRMLQARDTGNPVWALRDWYLTETRDHLLARNGPREANENCILERYFAPALAALDARRPELPPPAPGSGSSYASPALGHLDPAIPRGRLLALAPLPFGLALAASWGLARGARRSSAGASRGAGPP